MLGVAPFPVTVTTRIITLLGSGIPINPHSWDGATGPRPSAKDVWVRYLDKFLLQIFGRDFFFGFMPKEIRVRQTTPEVYLVKMVFHTFIPLFCQWNLRKKNNFFMGFQARYSTSKGFGCMNLVVAQLHHSPQYVIHVRFSAAKFP